MIIAQKNVPYDPHHGPILDCKLTSILVIILVLILGLADSGFLIQNLILT